MARNKMPKKMRLRATPAARSTEESFLRTLENFIRLKEEFDLGFCCFLAI